MLQFLIVSSFVAKYHRTKRKNLFKTGSNCCRISGFIRKWLNPEPEGLWQYRQSISVIRQIMNNRMFPVTIEGLERGMRLLSK